MADTPWTEPHARATCLTVTGLVMAARARMAWKQSSAGATSDLSLDVPEQRSKTYPTLAPDYGARRAVVTSIVTRNRVN
jgi:hypothetical protein